MRRTPGEKSAFSMSRSASAGNWQAVELSESYQGEIDMLVTDVVMPGMSGRQVAEALQGARPRMPVLYLSGYTENTVVHDGVLEPGVEFLAKPYSREALGE